jgi:glycosyltransferase involved in cell wall biosynthesis
MKILVLTSTFSRRENDTEPKFVDYLCQSLAKNNEIHVVAPHDRGIPTQESLSAGIEVFRFRYAPEHWETLAYNGGILPNLKNNRWKLLLVPFFVLSQLLLAIKLVRSNDYDVIHAHWIIPQGFIAAIARKFARRRLPVVLTSHGGDIFALQGSLFSRLKTWITRRTDHVTLVSSAMKEKATALGIRESNISVIPMGVDSQHTFVLPAENVVRDGLIFVGRLVDKKGIEYLIRALPLVLEKNPQQRLTVIGDGPLKESLLALCASTGVQHAVTFAGSLPNQMIPAYLQKSAIAIIPSVVTASGDQEGAPVAIMETLACGCATIVSDYPGARDIIVDSHNGLLVTPKSPTDIAERINYLLENPLVCSSLGKEGRDSVIKEFDWQVIAANFMAVFEAIHAGKTPTIKTSPID